MKYIVLLCDGMSDEPSEKLKNSTPMEIAKKTNIDTLFAKCNTYGLCQTVPDGFKPGSDIANMSVMGFAPEKYYTGRSPLEAASMGINLGENDVAIRTNIVTLSDDEDFYNKSMVDYCAGDISTEDADFLIKSLDEYLRFESPIKKYYAENFELYSGVSYRHCLVYNAKSTPAINTEKVGFVPPHDITRRKITEFISNLDEINSLLLDITKEANKWLSVHPFNVERSKNGINTANSIWFWGAGKRTVLPDFTEKTELKGAVISAVDLLKGIAKSANMQSHDVEGATGYLDTNFEGKATAAINALKNGVDYVYIHLEAPDECGHRGEYEKKIKAIELIDEKVLGRILDAFKNDDLLKNDDFRVLICPDHPTPLDKKTHTSDAVPFFIFDSSDIYEKQGEQSFTEKSVQNYLFINSGEELFNLLVNGSTYLNEMI